MFRRNRGMENLGKEMIRYNALRCKYLLEGLYVHLERSRGGQVI